MSVTISRSTHGLVQALFDTIDKLNNKEIDAEHARAVSHTARSIVQVARLELEWREFSENSSQKLTSLSMDEVKKVEPPKK